ncbi:bifunctional aspartate transaminase/aspartate 4-decarboxylase [Desulfoplanes sp.]
MSDSSKHPFLNELAHETQKGNVSRRDFLKYASLLGVSLPSAAMLIGLDPDTVVAKVAKTNQNWAALREESPFEIKNMLIKRAHDAVDKKPGMEVLNAGRGNPDFLNTTVRKATALLMLFAATDAESTNGSHKPDIGYRVNKEGLANRLKVFVNAHRDEPGGAFLKEAVDFVLSKVDMPPDEIAFELVDAIQGDFYPDPPRILPVVEDIVNRYLSKIVFSGHPPKGSFHLFATEGATAAMIYVFNSLKANKVLNPGDKVAIVTPVFSPYLELPVLADYDLKTVYVSGDEEKGWQIDDSEVSKLKDPAVKALYMVNPTNPTSVALNTDTIERMSATIKKHNPDMIIISDTVYASFVDTFDTFGRYLPENIIGVYSFSKYFGVTGWRLGAVMIHENSVVDRIIKKLPKRDQALLDLRYRLTSTNPEEIKFFERLEMDSREVALAHTGGLSCPQQVAMTLFALFELLDPQLEYKKNIMAILKERWSALYGALGIEEPTGNNLTRYYALIDLKKLAEMKKGKAFAATMTKGHPLDFLFRLADNQATICLPGRGFAGPEWSLRVALANIDAKDCVRVGQDILKVLDGYS